MSYCRRIHGTVVYCTPVVSSSHTWAFLLFLRAVFGNATINGAYRGIPFSFRSGDLSAIDETLTGGEHQFVVPMIASMEAPLILDIGMNVGDFSVLAVAVSPRSRILGVETDAVSATLARGSTHAGGMCLWTVNQRAAWRNSDQIFLEPSAASVRNTESETGHKSVPGIDLATLWSLLPSDEVDVMGIHVEGAEEDFLFSQLGLLQRVKHFIIEIHARACNGARIRDLLRHHFPCVEEVPGRISSKPLLFCMRT